jgi:protein involved in sex pheromone biosynthesis
MKRFLLIPGLVLLLLVGGCIPSLGGEDEELIQDTEESVEETVIIPDVQLNDEYYQTLIPFKKSASRGLVAEDRAGTKYDIKEVEEGLLRLSTQHFDPKDYYFQEGQYIDEKTAKSWLKRKGEGDNKKDEEDVGLNPKRAPEGTSDADIAKTAPDYLSHIVEQNYLVMTKDKKVKLEGISIGLALKSYYYNVSGREIAAIPDKQIEEQGMLMAEEVVKRLRAQEGLENIPIVVGLFKQNRRSAIVPGNYFATAVADKGKGLTGWKRINEKYVVFPTPTNDEKYRDTNTAFKNFKQAIDDYFPSFVNVIGRGLHKEGKLDSLTIEIPIQFYGTSETIGFIQYLVSIMPKYLPNVYTEVSITSINGPEALIIIKPGEDEPFVHIYGY